jgi:hypothetical protein
VYAVGRLRGGKNVSILIATVNNKSTVVEIDDEKTGYQLK